jgi:hypothetical protein
VFYIYVFADREDLFRNRMGNNESQASEQGSAAAITSNEMRACYYDVLEVERSDATTAEDIRKVDAKFPGHPFPSNCLFFYFPKLTPFPRLIAA